MNLKNKIYLPLLMAFIGLLIFQIVKPEPINWHPSFSMNDKIPFGSFIPFNMLDEIFGAENIYTSDKPIYNTLTDIVEPPDNYIFVSTEFNPDRLERGKLLNFVAEGGNAFISSSQLLDVFADTLGFKLNLEYIGDSVGVYLKNEFGINTLYNLKVSSPFIDLYDSLQNENIYDLEKDTTGWTSFIRVDFGAGKFFFHNIPSAFTNVSILSKPNEEYLAGLLSHLPVGVTIWDEYYKPANTSKSSTPLKFILGHPSLKWAYFVSMLGIFLYIFVEAKRKQRIKIGRASCRERV